MKKIISIVILLAMVALLATTVVRAEGATAKTLPDELYAIGQKYGMKASEKVKMERYLSEYPLSDAECNEILALANQADKLMSDNNTTNYHTLPAEVKAKLRALANEAAAIAGVTLDFGKDKIDVYKNGKLIEALQFGSNGKLVYTGTDTLPDEIYAIGSQYGMKESDKLRMVRYLSDYPLSDADCNRILALAQQADQIMKDNNTTDYHTLPADVKAQLKSLAVRAADIAGVTLDFGKDRIDVYKNGKMIEVLQFGSNGKLVYTGTDTLPDEIYAIGSKYGMKESDKVRIQRYLADYPLSNADCDKILSLAKEADQIMIDNNTTDYHTLPADMKSKLKGLALQAADIAGVTLDFKSDRIDVYKNGVLYEVLKFDGNGNLVYTGSDTLPDEIYAIGSKYGMTEAQRVEMERYLRENPLSDADCNTILDLARQADQIMKDNNTTDYHTLPADMKSKLKSLALEAADIAGVSLDFGKDKIDIYKDGKLINVLKFDGNGKLVYTGNGTNIALVVSSVVVIALAAAVVTVIVRKRLSANA